MSEKGSVGLGRNRRNRCGLETYATFTVRLKIAQEKFDPGGRCRILAEFPASPLVPADFSSYGLHHFQERLDRL